MVESFGMAMRWKKIEAVIQCLEMKNRIGLVSLLFVFKESDFTWCLNDEVGYSFVFNIESHTIFSLIAS